MTIGSEASAGRRCAGARRRRHFVPVARPPRAGRRRPGAPPSGSTRPRPKRGAEGDAAGEHEHVEPEPAGSHPPRKGPLGRHVGRDRRRRPRPARQEQRATTRLVHDRDDEPPRANDEAATRRSGDIAASKRGEDRTRTAPMPKQPSGSRSRRSRGRADRTTIGSSAWIAAAGTTNTAVRIRTPHAGPVSWCRSATRPASRPKRLGRQAHRRRDGVPPQEHEHDAEERRRVDEERPPRSRRRDQRAGEGRADGPPGVERQAGRARPPG